MAKSLRVLSRIEQAFTIINETYPLTAVGVLRLENGPAPETLRQAIGRLQEEHPYLQVSIRQEGGDYYFQHLSGAHPIPLEVVVRQDDQHWRREVLKILNQAFDPSCGPLIRFSYLIADSCPGKAELIVAYHHAIGDALSGIHCLHQLLTWCTAGEEQLPSKANTNVLMPGAESLFPPKFRGLSLWRRLLPFMGRQMWDEIRYKRMNQGVSAPTIPQSPINDFLLLSLDAETSAKLIARSRREKVSLAGVLAAAMLLAVWEKRYGSSKGLSRVIVFSDLRPYLKPPVATKFLGCYIALLRFSQELTGKTDFWSVADSLSQQIYQSGKRGERFLSAFLSKNLAKMNLRRTDQRMGTVAISYVGPVDLQPAYGSTKVLGIQGFVTNNPLGAELSALGKIVSDQIELDLQYLAEEMDAAEAADLAQRIKEWLVSALV